MGLTKLWHDDFAAVGYRPYRDSFKGQGEDHTPLDERMYQGSMQKRVRDDRGTRYFINVDFYDFSRVRGCAANNRSLSAEVQFSILDEMKRVVDISGIDGADPGEIEAFFADLWSRMGWGYYEVDDASVPAPSAPSAEGGR